MDKSDKCLRCGSELATLENESQAIKTRVCTNLQCGLIENTFYPKPLKALLAKAKREDATKR